MFRVQSFRLIFWCMHACVCIQETFNRHHLLVLLKINENFESQKSTQVHTTIQSQWGNLLWQVIHIVCLLACLPASLELYKNECMCACIQIWLGDKMPFALWFPQSNFQSSSRWTLLPIYLPKPTPMHRHTHRHTQQKVHNKDKVQNGNGITLFRSTIILVLQQLLLLATPHVILSW